MAGLTGHQVHLDQYLTSVIQNFQAEGMIGDRIAPVVNVPHQSDAILNYVQADLLRIPDMKRARGAEAHRVARQTGSTLFFAENYAVKEGLHIEDRANADPVFVKDMEEGKVMSLKGLLKLAQDKRWAGELTSASNVGTAAVVASAWGSYAVADPLGDIWTKADQLEAATGYRPNHYLFSGLSWNLFSRNNRVIDKVFGTGVTGGGLSASVQQAEVLLGGRVLVGNAFENTANPAAAAAALSRIWSDNVVIYRAPLNGPSTVEPSGLYNIAWVKEGLANEEVKRLPYDEKIQSQEFEIGHYRDELRLDTRFIALIRGVNSSQ